MNPRRDFFRQFFVGAAALPVVVKAVVSEPIKEGPFTFRKVREWQPAKPQPYYGEIQWYYIRDNGITWGLDRNPLRFTS